MLLASMAWATPPDKTPERRCADGARALISPTAIPTLDEVLSAQINDESKRLATQIYEIIALGEDDGAWKRKIVMHLISHGPESTMKLAIQGYGKSYQDSSFKRALNRQGLALHFRYLMEANAHIENPAVSVGFIDLTLFKLVNEILGYEEADKIIQDLVDSLTASLRDGDAVGRWGGDEIVIILGANKTNAELVLASKLHRARVELFERTAEAILVAMAKNPNLSALVEKAIGTTEVSPQILGTLGILAQISQTTTLNSHEKIAAGVVVLGSARFGVAQVNTGNLLSPGQLNPSNLDALLAKGVDEASKALTQKKLKESRALGLTSRP